MKPSVPGPPFPWQGPLPAPDFTMVPNIVFDLILPHLDGGAVKVLLYLIRETYGWHTDRAQLSLPDVCAGAGVSRRTAAEALKDFEAWGLVLVERKIGTHGKEASTYVLRVTEDRKYTNYTSDRQKVADSGRIESAPPGRIETSRPSYLLKKEGKEKESGPPRANKYTSGAYAVCAGCGTRPCSCGAARG